MISDTDYVSAGAEDAITDDYIKVNTVVPTQVSKNAR